MRPFLLLFHYPNVLVKLSTLYSFFTMSMNSFEMLLLKHLSHRLGANLNSGISTY